MRLLLLVQFEDAEGGLGFFGGELDVAFVRVARAHVYVARNLGFLDCAGLPAASGAKE